MSWRPSATLPNIRARARLYQQIRAFFADRGYLEVDTPLLSPGTIPDVNISSISVVSQRGQDYLQTSPEFAMKRLLAAGSGSIFQICHAFREGEEGRHHRSEFTLLEWYRVGFNYQQLMNEVEELVNAVSGHQHNFRRVSYRTLFDEALDIDVMKIDLAELRDICDQQVTGTDSHELDFDQCLDLLISLKIAPAMRDFVFVYDYPISQASLSKPSATNPAVAERFELFYRGLELANGFSELTNADQQRERFVADNHARQDQGLPVYPLDEKLLAALDAGLPECAGVALGLDRLLMVLLQVTDIKEVISFYD